MTTFQDPPPHSRRAVRQSERDESHSDTPQSDTAQYDSQQQNAPYRFDAASSAPEAPQTSPTSQVPTSQVPHTGRRAQLPPSATSSGAVPRDGQETPAGFEPLTYSTQGRVSPPVDERSQQQPLAAAPPPGSGDQASFRVRDFSPEGGRRAAPPREQAPSPLSGSSSFPVPVPAPAPAPSRASTAAVDLDYHTQGAPQPASHSAAQQPLDDALNHTLSRRELRELRAAEEQRAPALQLPESIDTLLNSGPIEIPTLAPPPGQSQALAEAMAEFDLLTRSRREAEARARDAQVASLATPIIPTQAIPIQTVPPQAAPTQAAPPHIVSVPVAPAPTVASVPVAPAPTVASLPVASVPVASVPVPAVASVPVASVPIPIVPVPSAPVAPVPVASVPVAPVPVESAPVPFVASVPQPTVLTTPIFSDPGSAPEVQVAESETVDADQDEHGGRSPRASNHWRVQAALEDDEHPYENTLSRTVGSNTSAITTSALVLPSVPQPDSMLASLNATGEILVTGSINLPRSLGATGAHPDRVDHADDEDDPFDSQVAAPDSAPVRAIRAISSNTSTRAVIETKRPQGNRMLTGVIIVASVLCVGLVGLLVFAFATGKL